MAIMYEQEFAPSEQASLSVDALVNDFDTDSGVVPTTVAQHMLEQPRRATPTIPPGFSAPGTPRLLPEQPVRPLSRTGITPAVPVIPATPIRAATPVKPPNKERRLADPPVEQHENDIGMEKARLDRLEPIETSRETQATPSRVAKDVTSVMTTTSSKASRKKVEPASTTHKDLKNPKVNVADDSQSHVKATSKIKRPVLDASPNKRISSTSVAVTEIQKDVRGTAVTHIGSSKRQPPGKLDIAAATQLSADEPADSGIGTSKGDVYPKNLRTVSLASESQPASPATTATGSPVKRSAPRTIRVLPTPKTENPPPLSANSMASLPQVPTVDKLRSRQASIASVNQPVTPISELTDNASVTSASMSRANSPPPGGKVGSAPVRKKTKAQAKKERQERARQIAEEQALTLEDSVKSSDPEPVQAPIVGRKKKTKKPTTTSTTAISSVAQSLPSSPPATISGKAAEDESSELKDVTVSEVKQQAPTSKKASSTKPSVSSPRKASQPSPTPSEEPKQEKGEPTAASILADLQRTGELLASTLEFFKPLSSTLSHVSRSTPATSPPADPNALPSPPDLKIHFSEADLDALAKKKPVRLGGGGGKNNSRTLITPQGKFLWSLTQELEEKVLDLEKSIEECKGAARWRPRQQAHGHGRSGSTHGQSSNYGADVLPAIATALKEAGANLGKSPQASTQGTSTSKLVPSAKTSSGTPSQQSIDDALVYLNQWVLPPSDSQHPNAPRPESFSVGGHPGSAKDAHASAHNLAAAAKAVAEGRVPASAIPMQDLENLGVYAAEVLGGYVVQGLEALVGAGLGVESGMGAYGSESLGMSGGSGRERGKLLSVEEAEQAMIMARKETEQLEKKVNALMKRNGRFVKGSVGGR